MKSSKLESSINLVLKRNSNPLDFSGVLILKTYTKVSQLVGLKPRCSGMTTHINNHILLLEVFLKSKYWFHPDEIYTALSCAALTMHKTYTSNTFPDLIWPGYNSCNICRLGLIKLMQLNMSCHARTPWFEILLVDCIT